MSERKAPGESLSRRVASRDGGLTRRQMSDGGEVYSGPAARHALRALGARAMTMDHTILVDDDFDESNPDDQALYAHERFHQMESGGADHPTSQHDSEEMGAQAIERMVLHRSHAGEDFGSIMRDVASGGEAAARSAPQGKGDAGDRSTDPSMSEAQRAYQALLGQGKSHQQIVSMLTQHCMDAIRQREDASPLRQFGTKRW